MLYSPGCRYAVVPSHDVVAQLTTASILTITVFGNRLNVLVVVVVVVVVVGLLTHDTVLDVVVPGQEPDNDWPAGHDDVQGVHALVSVVEVPPGHGVR